MDVNPAFTMPPETQNKYLSQLGRAAADLARARDTASTAVAEHSTGSLDAAFSYAYKAASQLHASFQYQPPSGAASSTRRAIDQVTEGLAELSRAFDNKPVSFADVRESWNDGIATIGRAQNLVKNPPSANVYDGS